VTNLWIAKSRIGPLRFQSGCHRRRPNLALVFLCLFCIVVHFFWLVNVCLYCVRFCFFPYQAKLLVWGTSPKLPILYRLGCETLTSDPGLVDKWTCWLADAARDCESLVHCGKPHCLWVVFVLFPSPRDSYSATVPHLSILVCKISL